MDSRVEKPIHVSIEHFRRAQRNASFRAPETQDGRLTLEAIEELAKGLITLSNALLEHDMALRRNAEHQSITNDHVLRIMDLIREKVPDNPS